MGGQNSADRQYGERWTCTVCVWWRRRQCSRTCGLGVQYRAVACADRSTNHSVDAHRCSAARRPHRQRNCSLGTCPTMWITSDWTPVCFARRTAQSRRLLRLSVCAITHNDLESRYFIDFIATMNYCFILCFVTVCVLLFNF